MQFFILDRDHGYHTTFVLPWIVFFNSRFLFINNFFLLYVFNTWKLCKFRFFKNKISVLWFRIFSCLFFQLPLCVTTIWTIVPFIFCTRIKYELLRKWWCYFFGIRFQQNIESRKNILQKHTLCLISVIISTDNINKCFMLINICCLWSFI